MATYTYDDVKARVLDIADMKTDQFALDTNIYAWIDTYLREVYSLLINTYEDYFLEVANVTTVNGQEKYLLPLDMYKIRQVFYVNNSEKYRYNLDRMTTEELQYSGYIYSPSPYYGYMRSLKYRIIGSYMHLVPIPAGGDTLEIWYVKGFQDYLSGTQVINLPLHIHWIDYVVLKVAERLLVKAEKNAGEISRLAAEARGALTLAAENRDIGKPKYINDVESSDVIAWETT